VLIINATNSIIIVVFSHRISLIWQHGISSFYYHFSTNVVLREVAWSLFTVTSALMLEALASVVHDTLGVWALAASLILFLDLILFGFIFTNGHCNIVFQSLNLRIWSFSTFR
jgi:hypothetical protein